MSELNILCQGGGQVPRLALFMSVLAFMSKDDWLKIPQISKSYSQEKLNVNINGVYLGTHIPNRLLIFLVIKSLIFNTDINIVFSKNSFEEEHLLSAIKLINYFGLVAIKVNQSNITISSLLRHKIDDLSNDSKKTSNQSVTTTDDYEKVVLNNIRADRPNPGINNQLCACIDSYNTMFKDYIRFDGSKGDVNIIVTKLYGDSSSLIEKFKISKLKGSIKGRATVMLTLQSLMPIIFMMSFVKKSITFDHNMSLDLIGGEVNGLNSPPLRDYIKFLEVLPIKFNLKTEFKDRTVHTSLVILDIDDNLTFDLKQSALGFKFGKTKPMLYWCTQPSKFEVNQTISKILPEVFSVTSQLTLSRNEMVTDRGNSDFKITEKKENPLFSSKSYKEFNDSLCNLIKKVHNKKVKRFNLFLTLVDTKDVPISILVENNFKKRFKVDPSTGKDEFIWFKSDIFESIPNLNVLYKS